MELVTGKAGTPHVSSADDGRRIAGEVGTGSYVLKTGGGLAPSLVDANTVRFATGDMVVQGRHIGLTAPEDVKVASGTQGKKRTDYICVHYKRDVAGSNPTLVETCEWKVLQGTPGADATAPTVPAGSILDGDGEATVPVASVDFDGLTTGTPKLLIPTLTPLADLGDSVSRRKIACGTVVIHKGANYFWDMMSFETAARHLGCSVSDFRVEDTGVGNLFCFVCSGDSTNWIGPMIAEFDPGRSQIRLRFTNTEAHVFRANWMLVLDTKP